LQDEPPRRQERQETARKETYDWFMVFLLAFLAVKNKTGGQIMDDKKAQKEPAPEIDRLAKIAIGCAIEVHRHLGPGYLEDVY
jgi:hypothetical protein